jgi:hypothetical protein
MVCDDIRNICCSRMERTSASDIVEVFRGFKPPQMVRDSPKRGVVLDVSINMEARS